MLSNFTDIVIKSLIEHARELVAPYTDPSKGPPDPSYTLQLSNDVSFGSNLFAVQKTFDGSFQFDVYYESASNKRKLDGLLPLAKLAKCPSLILL